MKHKRKINDIHLKSEIETGLELILGKRDAISLPFNCGTQHRELPAALELQREHRAEDSDDRNGHREPVKNVGHDECPVEDRQRQIANVDVGVDEQCLPVFRAERVDLGHDRGLRGEVLQLAVVVDIVVILVTFAYQPL